MKFFLCSCLGLVLPVSAFGQATETEAAPPAASRPADAQQQEKLKELVRNVQDEIEADETLRGVALTGAELVDDPEEGLEIQLKGRIRDPEQALQVKERVEQALEDDRYWRTGEEPPPVSTESMRVAQGDLQLASRYHGMALEHFWNEEYEKADEAFVRAMGEAPNDDVFRYWRVISALAQDQRERAKQKLVPLVELYPLGSRSPQIATALERLQGPLRRDLMELENEVLQDL